MMKENAHTEQTSSEHILPMVPVIIHSRNANESCKKQGKKNNAEFCNVTSLIEYFYFS